MLATFVVEHAWDECHPGWLWMGTMVCGYGWGCEMNIHPRAALSLYFEIRAVINLTKTVYVYPSVSYCSKPDMHCV